MITEEEWEEWLTLPATKAVQEWARNAREELKEQWAGGAFSDQFDMAMAVRNAGATGACSVFATVQELDFNTIVEIEDGKLIGPGAERQGDLNQTV